MKAKTSDEEKRVIETIRQQILNGNESNSEYGIIEVIRGDDFRYGGVFDMKVVKTIIGTKHEQELSYAYGEPFEEAYHFEMKNYRDYCNDTIIHTSEFRRADDSDSTQRLEIKRRKARMEFLKAKAALLPFYKRQGQIIIKGHSIPVTRKELIDAGLDPKQFGWKSIETSKTIAHATMGVSKRDMEIAKGLFTRENEETLEEENYGIHNNR